MANKWKNRIRLVLYSYLKDVDNQPHLVQWPRTYPMPRTWSKILDFNEEVIAIKESKNIENEAYDTLIKSEFSGAYHWIENNEDPRNKKLYPHLSSINKDSNHEENYDLN